MTIILILMNIGCDLASSVFKDDRVRLELSSRIIVEQE